MPTRSLAQGEDPTTKRPHYWTSFVVLALATLAYSVPQTLVIPALPAIQRSLHTSAAGASWLLTAFLFSSAIGTPIFGRLGDLFGKERALIFVIVLSALGSLVAATAPTLLVM